MNKEKGRNRMQDLARDIAVDFNGPVGDPRAKVRALEVQLGKSLPHHRFTGRASAKKLYGVTDRQYDRAMERLFETDFFHEAMTILPGAFEGLGTLYQRGYNIRFVSGCRGLTTDRIWRFIAEHKLKVAEVITGEEGKDKTFFYGPCVAAIDNEVNHLEPLLGHTDTIPILMLPPHGGVGAGVKQPRNLDRRIRVSTGWDGILKLLPALPVELQRAA